MPRGIYPRPSAIERFDAKFIPVPESGCWLWLGAISRGGYGVFFVKKWILAHRAAYELLHGLIPAGMQIDHLCRVRSCVNPQHLEAVTAAVNTRRGSNAERDKTHCPKGHPYSGENLYVSPKSRGRDCLICKRRRREEFYERTGR